MRKAVARIRAAAIAPTDPVGLGLVTVYKVPFGYEFEARRVMMTNGDLASPTTGFVADLTIPGFWVMYRASGQFVEWGAPKWGSLSQVPGAQTWSKQQGPYLRSGEVFEVAVDLFPSGQAFVMLEGVLYAPRKAT